MEGNYPLHFRCPISMEIMKDPVTISTGVTYERKNIEQWIFRYKKKTCPATMQVIDNPHYFTPNHTLRRLIQSWKDARSSTSSSSSPLRSTPSSSGKHDELVSLLKTMETSLFKVSSLKKIRNLISPASSNSTEIAADFVQCGGVESLVSIIVQILHEGSDFNAFRACEEALAVLNQLPIVASAEEDEEEDDIFRPLSKPEVVTAMVLMLQRGSAEARFHTIDIIKRMIRSTNYDWNSIIQDQGVGFFKSMLELISDDICSKASSCALEVLINILKNSKKTRLKAIESGAVCVLIELLPDASRSRCEKVLLLIKLLCGCAEGRQAFVDHGLGIAVVSKKMLRVSDATTALCVKILWLISNFFPTERVLQEMLVFGSVKKLLTLLHVAGAGGGSSTKEKVVRIFKLHGNSWRRYPCFPSELKDYLGAPSD